MPIRTISLRIALALAALALAGPQAPAQSVEIADWYRVSGLEDRRFNHAEYWAALDYVIAADHEDRVRVDRLGESIEGRSINAVTVGSGPTTVLLWSQMHGDESAASMSLADIINWFAASPDDDEHRRFLEERLTITMIPMLNPDGAERFIRHNALGVDVNRDARHLATPEGRILKAMRDSIGADFGFNLHDQGSRSAGPEGPLVAIALLAPAADQERSWEPVRQRARHLSAVIADTLQHEIPGLIARYDDSFTPRAFGDNMQAWGTSTVLIESGALEGDPQKQELRRLNVIALLAAFDAIARGDLQSESVSAYDDLPMNVGIANELLIKGGHVVMPDGSAYRADVGIFFDDAVARTGPRYGEVGDLAGVGAVETFDAAELFLHPDLGEEGILRRGDPVRLSIRRGPSPDSEEVLQITQVDGTSE